MDRIHQDGRVEERDQGPKYPIQAAPQGGEVVLMLSRQGLLLLDGNQKWTPALCSEQIEASKANFEATMI